MSGRNFLITFKCYSKVAFFVLMAYLPVLVMTISVPYELNLAQRSLASSETLGSSLTSSWSSMGGTPGGGGGGRGGLGPIAPKKAPGFRGPPAAAAAAAAPG